MLWAPQNFGRRRSGSRANPMELSARNITQIGSAQVGPMNHHHLAPPSTLQSSATPTFHFSPLRPRPPFLNSAPAAAAQHETFGARQFAAARDAAGGCADKSPEAKVRTPVGQPGSGFSQSQLLLLLLRHFLWPLATCALRELKFQTLIIYICSARASAAEVGVEVRAEAELTCLAR